jgi:hypothetical protein
MKPKPIATAIGARNNEPEIATLRKVETSATGMTIKACLVVGREIAPMIGRHIIEGIKLAPSQ